MALEEKSRLDQVVYEHTGVILYREVTQIVKDGEVIAETYRRTSLQPGDSLTGAPEDVTIIANALWTEEKIEQFISSRNEYNLNQEDII